MDGVKVLYEASHGINGIVLGDWFIHNMPEGRKFFHKQDLPYHFFLENTSREVQDKVFDVIRDVGKFDPKNIEDIADLPAAAIRLLASIGYKPHLAAILNLVMLEGIASHDLGDETLMQVLAHGDSSEILETYQNSEQKEELVRLKNHASLISRMATTTPTTTTTEMILSYGDLGQVLRCLLDTKICDRFSDEITERIRFSHRAQRQLIDWGVTEDQLSRKHYSALGLTCDQARK